MRPLIGILARPEMLNSGNDIYYIHKQINDAILRQGVQTIAIIPNQIQQFNNKNIHNTQKMQIDELKDLKRIIDMCDGIICQGGDEFYDYDLKTIEYCHIIDKPLLGICLGMQSMAYFFNGKLDKIKNNIHKNKNKYVHGVNIYPNSKLFKILTTNRVHVNSRHISQITHTKLNIVAVSDDGIIEAVEDSNKKFFIGVQWHPESMIEYDNLEEKIFSYFVKCCRRPNEY